MKEQYALAARREIAAVGDTTEPESTRLFVDGFGVEVAVAHTNRRAES